jgi:iron complex outermembrane receptor protein
MKHFLLKKRLFLAFFVSLVLLLNVIEAKAGENLYDLSISGRVYDVNTNEPLLGCAIVVKGTSIGTTTNADGNYSLKVPDEKAVLVFSFIGYEKQEIVVANKLQIDVGLRPSVSELSQIVVIGYGSTTKKDMTGAAKSIREADFNRGIITSPEQMLQGRVSGVNVTSASGEPGSAQGITIRGPGGIRTGSTPLFVLDGFALDNSSTGGAINPLTFLNPQDIESIDVLKDASATAIYGARGANGVVLITTKKGKAGFSSVNISSNIGVSTMARPIDVFSADQYRQEVRNIGGRLEDLGANTDWQKEISRTAITQNHNVSLNGGTNNLSYYASVGMQKQEGVLRNSQLDTYTGRINVSQKLWEGKLSIDVNLNATSTSNVRPPIGSLVGGALSGNPTYPAYDADGNPFQFVSGTNPLTTLRLEKDQTTINRIIGSISPSLTLAKGLVYKLNFGIDNSNSARDLQSLANAIPRQDGRLETRNTYNRNSLIENYLTYSWSNTDHNLVALAGHSFQKIFVQGRTYSINRFPITDIEPIYNPGIGQELNLANNKPTGFALINELQSFFSRVNYQFKDKYLLTATVRVDGSSKFGANNKYGVFPSISAGWRISEEAFLKNSFFTDLKLRAGWGQTGNQEIPAKITQPLFTSQVSATTSYPLDNTSNFPAGTSYTRLANPDIQWEVSSQTDIGLDFAVFGGALSGSFDFFNKVSNNILLEVIPADPVQPAGTFWTNVKDMTITNRGLEIELIYKYKNENGFSYEIGGNATFISNIVKNSPYSVIPSGSASGSGLTSATINGYINNQPIGTFFLREFIGFDERGLNLFRDVDGDGIVTDKDRVALGSALPTTQYNFNARVAYKGLELIANLNGVSGNKIYDNTANAIFYKLNLSRGINTIPEAITETRESLNNAAPVSSRYLKDGSFLRLNNLTLGYELNPKFVRLNKWISQIRFSLTGQNLFVITKYNGYDPEVNIDRTINGVLSYGIDYLSYPKAKSFIFGLNVTF